jgi:hypothetical protein
VKLGFLRAKEVNNPEMVKLKASSTLSELSKTPLILISVGFTYGYSHLTTSWFLEPINPAQKGGLNGYSHLTTSWFFRTNQPYPKGGAKWLFTFNHFVVFRTNQPCPEGRAK